MEIDDLLIGSGLSALGAALALAPTRRRVLCVTGPRAGILETYPGASVPAAYHGEGGLGRYWHGVVPLASSSGFPSVSRQQIKGFLARFYPGFDASRHPADTLFVPYRPIRPLEHLRALAARHPNLVLRSGTVERIEEPEGGVRAVLSGGEAVWSQRALCAAGALGTVRLLMRSGLIDNARRTVSDHLIGYAGLVGRESVAEELARPVVRSRHGLVVPCRYSADGGVLYLLRPARFDFAELDAGIEKRAVFGLPTSKIMAGLLGKFSAGLIAEAFYNRFGIGRRAPWQSVNFLIEGRDVYTLVGTGDLVPPRVEKIRELARMAAAKLPFEGVINSRRPELYIPSIHLHASLTEAERLRFDPSGGGAIKVVDASALSGIGPAHHSFKMMIAAYNAVLP